ncbi:hypothetical protein BJX66DRAFT_337581 [Aspergillus keveii]|uniref:Uncharacterized protein n=1 Tax=Aspergillus keveii TaxID=714993 RepID=A0ABR4G716_9EURO
MEHMPVFRPPVTTSMRWPWRSYFTQGLSELVRASWQASPGLPWFPLFALLRAPPPMVFHPMASTWAPPRPFVSGPLSGGPSTYPRPFGPPQPAMNFHPVASTRTSSPPFASGPLGPSNYPPQFIPPQHWPKCSHHPDSVPSSAGKEEDQHVEKSVKCFDESDEDFFYSDDEDHLYSGDDGYFCTGRRYDLDDD